MAATIKKDDNDNAQAYVIPRNFTSAGTFSKMFHIFLYLEYQDFFFPNSEGNWKKNPPPPQFSREKP